MVHRWQGYVEKGVFALSVPLETRLGEQRGGKYEFWTAHWPYWDMKEKAKTLWETLKASGLVIFKVSYLCSFIICSYLLKVSLVCARVI